MGLGLSVTLIAQNYYTVYSNKNYKFYNDKTSRKCWPSPQG